MLGSTTTAVVVPLVAVTAFDAGAAWMGLLTAAAWLPCLVVGLPAGAWIDRADARRVMIVADLGAAASIGSVPVAWAMGVLTLPHLVVAALGVGTASVFLRAAYLPLLPRVVRPADLATANARLLGTESAMQVVGPGLGGALVAVVSAAYAVVVDALSFVVSALCLHLMDRRRLVPPSPPERREPLRREVATGIRVVARDPYLRFFTLQGGASNFALTGYSALLVLFLVRDLDLDPSGVGIVHVGRERRRAGRCLGRPTGRDPVGERPRDGRAPGVLRPAGPADRDGAARRSRRARPSRTGAGRDGGGGGQRHPRHLPDALHPAAAAGPHHGELLAGQLRHHAGRRPGCRLARAAPRGEGDDRGDGRDPPGLDAHHPGRTVRARCATCRISRWRRGAAGRRRRRGRAPSRR